MQVQSREGCCEFLEKGMRPGHVITEFAQAQNAGTIVLGTRGMGKIRRTISDQSVTL